MKKVDPQILETYVAGVLNTFNTIAEASGAYVATQAFCSALACIAGEQKEPEKTLDHIITLLDHCFDNGQKHKANGGCEECNGD